MHGEGSIGLSARGGTDELSRRGSGQSTGLCDREQRRRLVCTAVELQAWVRWLEFN